MREFGAKDTRRLANLKAIDFNSLDRFWFKEQGISLMQIREFVFGEQGTARTRSGNLRFATLWAVRDPSTKKQRAAPSGPPFGQIAVSVVNGSDRETAGSAPASSTPCSP